MKAPKAAKAPPPMPKPPKGKGHGLVIIMIHAGPAKGMPKGPPKKGK